MDEHEKEKDSAENGLGQSENTNKDDETNEESNEEDMTDNGYGIYGIPLAESYTPFLKYLDYLIKNSIDCSCSINEYFQKLNELYTSIKQNVQECFDTETPIFYDNDGTIYPNEDIDKAKGNLLPGRPFKGIPVFVEAKDLTKFITSMDNVRKVLKNCCTASRSIDDSIKEEDPKEPFKVYDVVAHKSEIIILDQIDRFGVDTYPEHHHVIYCKTPCACRRSGVLYVSKKTWTNLKSKC